MPADHDTETASYMSAPVSDENAPLTPQEEALQGGQLEWMQTLSERYSSTR